MAGFTDAPFRLLAREYGSAWAVTEMVSAKGMVLGDIKGIEIGEPYPDEPDLVIQVFGGEPELVAAGGRILFDMYTPQALDLNMGCPVKKITGKSCGSKLMLEPERAAAIVAALKAAVPVPVSAKMRLGYDVINVLEVAAALEEAGADLLAVHGRTATQKYTGQADWDMIYQVAEQAAIPVVGSGDVTTTAQFEAHRQSVTKGNLGVMVARGAVGRPWLFAELQGQAAPTVTEIARIVYRHALLHLNWYGDGTPEREVQLMRKLRGQLLRYFDFLPAARSEVVRLESLADLRTFIQKHLDLDLRDDTTDELKRDLGKARRRKKRLEAAAFQTV